MRGQYPGKAPCAAAEVDDQRNLGPIDVNREQIMPEPNRFWRKGAGLVVGGRNLGLVVVHSGDDPDQHLADLPQSLLVTSLTAPATRPLSLCGIRYSNKSSRRKPVSVKM